jgi:hypothetical protein
MFEIKACAVSKKRSPGGYRDEFFRNKRNAKIGHYGQTLVSKQNRNLSNALILF